jgi:hypothetical protein
MVSETYEHVCHVLKNDSSEIEHKPNFKNLVGAQKSKFSKPLFMGPSAFMHVVKEGDAFLIYALLAIDANPQQHEILS